MGSPDAPRLRYSPTIKELPADERPRERLAAYGASALTTAELLAILIRVGNAQRSAVSLGEHLLAHFGNIQEVACASVEALAKVHGIGTAKAAQIKAAIEFGNRVSLFSGDARPVIGNPKDVSNLLMPDLRYTKKEILKSLLLTPKTKSWRSKPSPSAICRPPSSTPARSFRMRWSSAPPRSSSPTTILPATPRPAPRTSPSPAA